MMLGAATDVLNPMGDTMPDGLWAGTRYWALPNESSEANQTFVQKFLDQHDKIPSYNAEGAYRGLYLFKKAIEAAGSSNADDVVGSLEGIQHSGPVGEYTVDSDSHQAGVPSSWGKTSYSEERGVSVLEPFDPVDTSPDTLNSLLEEGTGGRWPAGL
jgi:branched-chain amino acid transport system substrate-binding protein